MPKSNSNPFTTVGDNVFNSIENHLSQSTKQVLTLNEFFEQRIQIKDLWKNIIALRPSSIQLEHQARKRKFIDAGKKARFLLLKYRRGGFTTWEQATSYKMVCTEPHSTCVTLADNKPNTESIFRMVKRMHDYDDKAPKVTGDSKSHLEFNNGSIFQIGTAGQKAFKRGDGIERAHGSEVAFWPGNPTLIDNLTSGLIEAARYGEVVYETTANGSFGWFYEKFVEAMNGDGPWNPLFYAWFDDPLNFILPTEELKTEYFDTIKDEEKKVQEKYYLTLEQMLFRRDKQKEHGKLFQQEFPESWEEAFLVRGSTFFELETIAKLSVGCSDPLRGSYEGNLIQWKLPEPDRDYCAGADPAAGNWDSDFSVCAILDKKTGEQAAVLRGKWRPEVFARKCVELCKKYNNAIFACEIENHGHSVLNTVVNTLHYKHLYYHMKVLKKNKFGKDENEKVTGWSTNGSTRPIMLDELNEALEENHLLVNDKLFISEAKTFVDEGKRYSAESGQHDDTIMAWGITWQCRKQKKKSYITV